MNSESPCFFYFQIFNNLSRPVRHKPYLTERTPVGQIPWVADVSDYELSDALKETPHEKDPLHAAMLYVPSGIFWIGRPGIHKNDSAKGLSGIWLVSDNRAKTLTPKDTQTSDLILAPDRDHNQRKFYPPAT